MVNSTAFIDMENEKKKDKENIKNKKAFLWAPNQHFLKDRVTLKTGLMLKII